uniref:Uncharacterized protein n=1 Tax=Cucumis melo TaxID=3656 RepID=A0A9I9CE10_CUCME
MNEKASVSKELEAKHTKSLRILVVDSGRPSQVTGKQGMCGLPEQFSNTLKQAFKTAERKSPCTFISMEIMYDLLPLIHGYRNKLHLCSLLEVAAMGNERSNCYWEAELPPNFDRKENQMFIRAKYEEKRWVSKNRTHPAPQLGGARSVYCDSVEIGPRNSISKKMRNFSLEEEILTKHVTRATPTVAKARGWEGMMGGCTHVLPGNKRPGNLKRIKENSLDMRNHMIASAPPRGPSFVKEIDPSTKNTNQSPDLFKYVQDAKKDCSSVIPARWATFDCKYPLSNF